MRRYGMALKQSRIAIESMRDYPAGITLKLPGC
jgi:hypothetical protein